MHMSIYVCIYIYRCICDSVCVRVCVYMCVCMALAAQHGRSRVATGLKQPVLREVLMVAEKPSVARLIADFLCPQSERLRERRQDLQLAGPNEVPGPAKDPNS